MACLPKSEYPVLQPDSPVSTDSTLGYEFDLFRQENLEILQGIDLWHE
jgi:hypothetical protein